MATEPDPGLVAFARDAGLIGEGETARWTPLTGGVSSDIWRLDAGGRTVCVKRALAQLRTVAEWRAPISRNLYEWRWFETVAAAFPEAVPEPIAIDLERGAFAMAFLPAADHPLWKAQLLAGHADVATAHAVGDLLGRIHAVTARKADVAALFPTDDLFHALRIDPYLLATAARRPEAATALRRVAARTEATHLALVHGDVSPKNILVGPNGPVILDAECAWYGDPAFDLAFCLNHLMLKQLVAPMARTALQACFGALAGAYLARVDWEPRPALEARAADLLPGLFLARVDGKSPVEYLTLEAPKATVRKVAIALLNDPATTLAAVNAAWAAELAATEGAAPLDAAPGS